jgi:hypothetical protein
VFNFDWELKTEEFRIPSTEAYPNVPGLPREQRNEYNKRIDMTGRFYPSRATQSLYTSTAIEQGSNGPFQMKPVP